MKIIKPGIFSNSDGIVAAFTESNRFSPNYGAPGLDFGINTSVGESETEQNYNRLCNQFGFQQDSIALANQIHGSHIEIVEKPGVYENTDGLISKTRGLVLGIQVADCAAVLIADNINRIIGTFHAGWRGAVAGIILKGLQEMESIGADKKKLKTYISPCISKEKFEVGEEVAVQFPDSFVDRTNYSKPHVDLKGFLRHQIVEFGVRPEHIEVSPECTMQDSRFFSYRVEREKAGRMLGLITLNQ